MRTTIKMAVNTKQSPNYSFIKVMPIIEEAKLWKSINFVEKPKYVLDDNNQYIPEYQTRYGVGNYEVEFNKKFD